MTGAQDTRSEHPPAAEEFKEDASQKQASEQAENETTKDMEGIEADNDEQAKHATMQANSAEGTKVLDAKQETPNSRKLIVPKKSHIPIKLTMTDIFKQSKERQAAQVAEPTKPGECQASTPGENDVLQVKANIWMSQEELKRTKTKTPPNTNAPEASKQQVELPPKPASWGKVSVVTPEMQDPPKKRGRKPKHESEKATTDGKGKANMNGEKNQNGASAKQPAKTTLSPSQRTRQYLLNQKKKRSTEASSTKGGEKGANEDDAEKPPRKVRRTSKTNDETKKPVESAGDAVAEPETKKRRKTTERKQLDHQGDKKSDAGKHEKKTKKTEKKQKDEREAERKKRYSRKSAAYHAAFRATQGTNEEKKAAAKKAHCLHLELEYLHARMMCSCNGCVSINGVGVHLS